MSVPYVLQVMGHVVYLYIHIRLYMGIRSRTFKCYRNKYINSLTEHDEHMNSIDLLHHCDNIPFELELYNGTIYF